MTPARTPTATDATPIPISPSFTISSLAIDLSTSAWRKVGASCSRRLRKGGPEGAEGGSHYARPERQRTHLEHLFAEVEGLGVLPALEEPHCVAGKASTELGSPGSSS